MSQILMATMSLRRTKDKGIIGLPAKIIEICRVELSVDESKLYDQFEGQAKNVIQNFMDEGSLERNYSTVLSILLRLRQICASMALLPPDLRSFLPSSNIEGVVNSSPIIFLSLLYLFMFV